MKRYGLFKAVICDGSAEYCFPLIPEKHLALKRIISLLLLSGLLYLVLNPPLFQPGPVPLGQAVPLTEKRDSSGRTGLHRAVIRGSRSVVSLWLRRGADPDAGDRYGWTPLHWASFLGRDDLAELLRRGGARNDIPSTKCWWRYPSGSLPDDVRDSF